MNEKKISLLLILGSITAFGPLSIDMYLPAFPQISREFGATLSRVELTLAAFFAGLAIGQLFYGPLSDRFGRKKPLYAGLLIYLFSSYMCASTSSIEALIVFRFLQALGSCSGMVISRAIVRDLYQTQDSARVFSTLMLIMGAAPILAPLIGGYISLHFSWRWLFWLLVFLSSGVLVAIFHFLPETKSPNPQYTLKHALRTYAVILKDQKFMGYALSGGCAQAGMFAYITGSPFVFINFFKIPSQYFGLIFGANAFALIVFSQINGKLVHYYDLHQILKKVYGCLLIISIGLLVAGLKGSHYLMLAVPLFFYIGLLGLVFPNSMAQALSGHGQNAGSASSLVGTIQFTLASIASSLVSSFHANGPLTMTAIMTFFGISAFLLFKTMVDGPIKEI